MNKKLFVRNIQSNFLEIAENSNNKCSIIARYFLKIIPFDTFQYINRIPNMYVISSHDGHYAYMYYVSLTLVHNKYQTFFII